MSTAQWVWRQDVMKRCEPPRQTAGRSTVFILVGTLARTRAISIFWYPRFTRQHGNWFTCTVPLKLHEDPWGRHHSCFTDEGKELRRLPVAVVEPGFPASKAPRLSRLCVKCPDGSCLLCTHDSSTKDKAVGPWLDHRVVTAQESVFLSLLCWQGARPLGPPRDSGFLGNVSDSLLNTKHTS